MVYHSESDSRLHSVSHWKGTMPTPKGSPDNVFVWMARPQEKKEMPRVEEKPWPVVILLSLRDLDKRVVQATLGVGLRVILPRDDCGRRTRPVGLEAGGERRRLAGFAVRLLLATDQRELARYLAAISMAIPRGYPPRQCAERPRFTVATSLSCGIRSTFSWPESFVPPSRSS